MCELNGVEGRTDARTVAGSNIPFPPISDGARPTENKLNAFLGSGHNVKLIAGQYRSTDVGTASIVIEARKKKSRTIEKAYRRVSGELWLSLTERISGTIVKKMCRTFAAPRDKVTVTENTRD